jgi:hypothetical protein
VTTLLLSVALGYGGLVLVTWALQRRMIYLPFGGPGRAAAAGLAGAEEVSIRTEDGVSLGAWFVPPAAPAGGAAVLVCNGNGGNRAFRAPLAAALSRLGLGTLLFDYRGYGGNPGSPGEEALAADARAALAYLRGRGDVDPSRVVYFGESLGAAVCLRLAAESPPAALILRSPFTSLAAVGQHHYPFLPVSWLLRDRYAALDRIAGLRAPLLVIAGDGDRIVPFALSRRLFDAAPEPKRFLAIPGADHNDFEMLAGDALLAEVREFLGERGVLLERTDLRSEAGASPPG